MLNRQYIPNAVAFPLPVVRAFPIFANSTSPALLAAAAIRSPPDAFTTRHRVFSCWQYDTVAVAGDRWFDFPYFWFEFSEAGSLLQVSLDRMAG